MKLKFEAMQILMEELQQNEMWAIYLMGLGKAMTEKVTKANLTNIIKVLCKNLKWIEELQDEEDSNQDNSHSHSATSAEDASKQHLDNVEYTAEDPTENTYQDDQGDKIGLNDPMFNRVKV